jgi:hypothetical protein
MQVIGGVGAVSHPREINYVVLVDDEPKALIHEKLESSRCAASI